MRLWDHVELYGAKSLEADGGVKHTWPNHPPDTVVVDVTNVADYWYGLSKKEVSFDNDFPNMAPPWPNAWFEYRSPIDGDRLASQQTAVRLQAGGWFVMLSWFLRPHDADRHEPAMLVGRNHYVLSPEGQAIGDARSRLPTESVSNEERERIESALGYELHGGLTSLIFGPKSAGERFASVVRDMMRDSSCVTWLATSFAHCKNVSLVEHATPPKVATKRAKAGKPVGVTYKTLVIDGMKQTLRSEGGIEKNGLKKALHICRGHFATYTPDKPLFGKVVGTVWKPMHTRGDKSRGEVKKDYKIAPQNGGTA